MTAIRHGATALGLVGPMPSGPGPIGLDLIARIVSDIPAGIDSYYLTSKTQLEDIVSEYDKVKSSHLQLTDYVTEEVRLSLKSKYPKLKLVQVIHVTDESSIALARKMSSSSDFLLLDSGAPHNDIKELGGTGRTHNWDISRQIVEAVNIPVYLAGGLNAGNVKEAFRTVKPYGIDLCSGVRTSNNLDPHKLGKFFDVASLLNY